MILVHLGSLCLSPSKHPLLNHHINNVLLLVANTTAIPGAKLDENAAELVCVDAFADRLLVRAEPGRVDE